VGDGVWDLRACRKLGIRFIGVGNKREKLLEAEATHVLEDLTSKEFWRAHAEVGAIHRGSTPFGFVGAGR
jgi:hypothetical protein